MHDDDIQVVHVATASNETIAMMWVDVLRENGIVSMVKGGASGYGLGHNLLNEQYIVVRNDQAEEARSILSDLVEEDGVILWETS